jgi:hypothetical protein
MKFRPENGDLRMVSAFVIGLIVGMALMIGWREVMVRRPVYAIPLSRPTVERDSP